MSPSESCQSGHGPKIAQIVAPDHFTPALKIRARRAHSLGCAAAHCVPVGQQIVEHRWHVHAAISRQAKRQGRGHLEAVTHASQSSPYWKLIAPFANFTRRPTRLRLISTTSGTWGYLRGTTRRHPRWTCRLVGAARSGCQDRAWRSRGAVCPALSPGCRSR